ncbi:MAG: hypothetical protein LBR71_05765 [Synergistaceae bacterium]|jgi:hypothetical protein|nr:hypothetical protein [Synergistaceae bacterium]
MESAKFWKRLLTAFLALNFSLTFSAAGPLGRLSVRFAEAGSTVADLEGYRNKLLALEAARIAAYALESQLPDVEKKITQDMAAIAAEALRRDTTEVQPEYKKDHETLKDVVWKDITAEVGAIYDALRSADNLFSVPGYRTPPEGGETLRFSELYKDRVGQWQAYATAAIAANKTQTGDATSVQTTIKSLHDASLAAAGYRQLLQSRHQTANFMNQEISKLRMDIQRQIDAETQIALNERQERADWQAAFDQAVNRWKSQTQGKGY